MAKDDERPQFNPKHRIAGAIILVSLAVIFVPMMLDESAPPRQNAKLTEIPARDALTADTKVVVTPVQAPSPAKTQSAVAEPVAEKLFQEKAVIETAPAVRNETAKAETKAGPVVAVEKQSDAQAAPKHVVAKPSEVSEQPAQLVKGWVVQVGTFANSDNAERLKDKLKNHGYSVHADSVMVQGSKALRLRLGPFRDKSAAIKAQAQLHRDLNIQGMVLAHP